MPVISCEIFLIVRGVIIIVLLREVRIALPAKATAQAAVRVHPEAAAEVLHR